MNKILLITEGKRPDKPLVEGLFSYYKKNKSNTDYCIVEYSTNVHLLYENIKKEYGDDMEDIRIITILSEKNKNFKYKKDDFSEIYLFFDYDIHHYMFNDRLSIEQLNKNLKEMLCYFNDETGDLGKLYINYPMVESFFVDKLEEVEINSLKQYKRKDDINKNKGKFLQNGEKFLVNNSNEILKSHIEVENDIVNGKITTGNYEEYQKITQLKILEGQISKYVCRNVVRELSTLPRFIIEYFGERIYEIVK